IHSAAAVHRQQPYTVRFEWGLAGARVIAPGADLAGVGDVLSFTTWGRVAMGRGAEVYPYPWKDAGAEDFATHHGAELAGPRNGGGLSLSPASLRAADSLQQLRLPAPDPL